MVKKILYLDFVMTKWFVGKKKDRLVPSTVYFFMSKLIYLGAIFATFLLKLIGMDKPIFVTGGIIVCGTIISIISLDSVEKMVKNPIFEKEFKKLSKPQIYKKGMFAFFLFFGCLFFMMWALIFISRMKI